jgi:hypothetical protein
VGAAAAVFDLVVIEFLAILPRITFLSAFQELTSWLSPRLVIKATIFAAGGVVSRLVGEQLGRSVFYPEVRALADRAILPQSVPEERSTEGTQYWRNNPDWLYWSNKLSWLNSLWRRYWPVGFVIAALVALIPSVLLAIGVVIYLAWAFEGLLMKAELEAIACKLKEESDKKGRWLEPDIEWIHRARMLLNELRQHGFEIDQARSGGNLPRFP